LSNNHLYKITELEKEKLILLTFERSRKGIDKFNFMKLLKENDMVWSELSPGYGQITHNSTGLSVYMEVIPSTTSRHKIYNLEKLKDKVATHLYKNNLGELPVNINI